MRSQRALSAAVIVSGALAFAAAHAQPRPGLGQAPQPKVAAPSAAPSVKAGEGAADLDPAARATALKAAIERCDLTEALALGASAADAARIILAVNRIGNFLPGTAAWIQSNGRLSLAARTDAGRAGSLPGTPKIGTYTPPGGVAGLPTLTEAFGPNPPIQIIPSPLTLELGKRALEGAAAKDLAREYLARMPAKPQYSDNAMDAGQAWYGPINGVVVGLFIPQFSTQGMFGLTGVQLPGTEAMVGGPRVLQQQPRIEIPAWVKDLPPSPPPPPPVTQC